MKQGVFQDDEGAVRHMQAVCGEYVGQRGFHLMVWGALLTVLYVLRTLESFQFVTLSGQIVEWSWAAVVVPGVFASVLFERYNAGLPRNFVAFVLASFWFGTGVSLIIVFFLGGASGFVTAGVHGAMIASLIGLAAWGSAAVLDMPWPRYLACIWWMGAIVLFFLTQPAALFLMACLCFSCGLLPGLALYIGYRRRTSSHVDHTAA